MPREGTHTRRTNYAVNLRVYTRTRNNAGNFERLHGSRGNVHPTPAGVGTGCTGGSGELCGVPRGLCGRRARKTSELQLFTSADVSGNHDTVTNEREKGEKVHMRNVAGTRRKAGGRKIKERKGEEHLRVCAGSAQLAVTNGRRGRRKKFRSRVLRECT